MKLYELLIAGFLLPAFWFGWMWACRLLAVAAAARLIGGAKDKLMSKLKGEEKADA